MFFFQCLKIEITNYSTHWWGEIVFEQSYTRQKPKRHQKRFFKNFNPKDDPFGKWKGLWRKCTVPE